ncbi:MAG TPA: glycosyltransferase family A protein, partial [Flavisolibacter sp.]|nr:glycosyltransferase family A protein [Flavisolibacter sp.]
TENLVKTYLTDIRIRYEKKENGGGAQTRNFGVSLAKRDFIVFLDSDDEAYPEWLETAYQYIRKDTGIVCMGAIRKLPDGTAIEEMPYEICVYGKKTNVKFTAGSMFIRRSLYLASGGYDMKMPSGLQSQLGYTLLEYLDRTKLKIVSINRCLVQINVHTGQRVRTEWNTLTVDCLSFVNKFLPYFKRWDRKELSNNYTVIAYYNYRAKKRKESVIYLIKAIRYRPQRVSNYVRLVKYSLL